MGLLVFIPGEGNESFRADREPLYLRLERGRRRFLYQTGFVDAEPNVSRQWALSGLYRPLRDTCGRPSLFQPMWFFVITDLARHPTWLNFRNLFQYLSSLFCFYNQRAKGLYSNGEGKVGSCITTSWRLLPASKSFCSACLSISTSIPSATDAERWVEASEL